MCGGTVRPGNLLKQLRAPGPVPPALHHLTLSEHNQTHFSRGYLERAKRVLALFSIIAIRQILQRSYICLQLSVIQGLEERKLSRTLNKFPTPGVTFAFQSVLIFI